MNHVARVYAAARQVRGLSREMARAAIEGYLDALADEIAQGDWVVLPGIGRIQVGLRVNGGLLCNALDADPAIRRTPGMSVQTKIRLNAQFKAKCRAGTIDRVSILKK